MGMTADQYAQALRNQLTTQQLINGVAGTGFMLKGETDELAALVQQRIVREATIDVNALAAKQSVTEQEVASYYEQNKNNFMTPEQFHELHQAGRRCYAGRRPAMLIFSPLTTTSIRTSSSAAA